MTLFFAIAAWAFLEALQDPEPGTRLVSPAVFFSFFREAVEIFLLICLGAGVLSQLNLRMPGTQDYFAASGMMLFYLYGRVRGRRESFIWMAFSLVYFLSREPSFAVIAARAVKIAAGVSGIRMILKGIRKRQLFLPAPAFFAGLSGFFVTAAIISLIFFPIFVR